MYFSLVFSTMSAGSVDAGAGLVELDVFEVVADELLVETFLIAAGLVLVGGPEARGIGREHLVDQDYLAVHP